MLVGDFEYDQMEEVNPRVAPFFFVTFVVVVFLVLTNVFVAILSEHYEKVTNEGNDKKSKTNSKKDAGEIQQISLNDETEYDLAHFLRTYFNKFSPFVTLTDDQPPLHCRSGQVVKLVSTAVTDADKRATNARVMFRRVIWRVLALLRFGVKFQRGARLFKEGLQRDTKASASKPRYTTIPLSSNCDHATLRDVLPIGSNVYLDCNKSSQIRGYNAKAVKLTVTHHDAYSFTCQVVGTPGEEFELVGGETLVVPWRIKLPWLFQQLLEDYRTKDEESPIINDNDLMRLMDVTYVSERKKMLRTPGFIKFIQESKKPAETEISISSFRFDQVKSMIERFIRSELPGESEDLLSIDAAEETQRLMLRCSGALIHMSSRERVGYQYVPRPQDTSQIVLDIELRQVSEVLARNVHDAWAKGRLEEGWKFGTQRNDKLKLHPNLIPYECLSAKEQDYDRRTSLETLKTLLVLNCKIIQTSPSPNQDRKLIKRVASIKTVDAPVDESSDAECIFQCSYNIETQGQMQTRMYTPKPIDVSSVTLPKHLLVLAELLAENAHEVWSAGRMKDGWKYGEVRDDAKKRHPCLVPYIFLTEIEKSYDIITAMSTLRAVIALGFDIETANHDG